MLLLHYFSLTNWYFQVGVAMWNRKLISEKHLLSLPKMRLNDYLEYKIEIKLPALFYLPIFLSIIFILGPYGNNILHHLLILHNEWFHVCCFALDNYICI